MPRHRSAKTLLDLPQQKESWFVAIQQMRAWVDSEDGAPFRPWITFVVVTDIGMIQQVELLQNRPTAKDLSDILYKTIKQRHPVTNAKPHRPTVIAIENSELADALIPEFADFDIHVQFTPRPPGFDDVIAELEQSMQGSTFIPGLLAAEGVTPELVGRFFDAAADFYEAEVWDMLNDSEPVKIEVSGDKRKRTVAVMGDGGLEYGLAVYDAWKDYIRVIENSGDPEKSIPAKGAHALYFNEITETPFDDLEAVEKYGWRITEDELYPVPITIKPKEEAVKRPSLADIEWYEAVLRALPIFVDEHLEVNDDDELQPADAKISVETAKGTREVHITYPAGELPSRLLMAPVQERISDDDMANFRRAMEGMLSGLGLSLPNELSDEPVVKTGGQDSAVDQAQQIMYDAWEEKSKVKRIAKAKQALAISADCADAYVLLAEEAAKTREEAINYYEQGIAAGERALGKKFFKENAGYFWGLIETRPYMRARAGLATTLWSVERKDEASQHFRELLRLNPNDNQGIRYSLLNLLLEEQKDDDARKLIKQYPDDAMAEWMYSQALLAFRKDGASVAAKKLLNAAIKGNEYVPAYLTGKKRIPAKLPPYVGFGDEDEAVTYASSHLRHWRATPGAVDWLKTVAK
ncbi:MAG: hypothetical protein U0175_22645 [Caldilineaceae bacterium]